MRDDRALALDLDRALAGEDAPAEARALAALLVAAAEPARLDVPPDEVERALSAVRPPRRAARSRPRLVVALAAALALAAVAFATLRTPGTDVQARAAEALDRTFFVVEEIRPVRAGLFEPSISAGYFDPHRGRGHWTLSTRGGRLVAETSVEGRRVVRYDAASNTITVAESCRAFATGCSQALDPFDLYRRALESDAARIERTGDAWRLTLRGTRVEQVALVDARTFLPRRIEWREHGRAVSVIRFVTLEPRPAVDEASFRFEPHPGARVRHLSASGEPVRELSARAIAVPHGAVWLGPRYFGSPARAEAVRFTTGEATRVSYGPLRVWTYGATVPPEVAAGRLGGVKEAVLPGGVALRVYFGPTGSVVAEREVGGATAAVVSDFAGKVDIVEAARALRRVP